MTDAENAKIIEIIADKLSIDKSKISEDTSFEDIGADSLDLVQVTMAIEEEFDLDEIPEEASEKLKTLKDIITYIDENKK